MNPIKVQRERKNFCRLFTFSRKTSHQEILCFKVPGIIRAATAKKSDRKACVIMHVQSNQCSARENPLIEFFDFPKVPFNREFDGHNLPYYVLLYLAIIEFGFRRIWRILQIEEEGVIHLGRRRILHILRKPNSIIVLLFLQNNSKFKNKLKHANLERCKFVSIIHLYREV